MIYIYIYTVCDLSSNPSFWGGLRNVFWGTLDLALGIHVAEVMGACAWGKLTATKAHFFFFKGLEYGKTSSCGKSLEYRDIHGILQLSIIRITGFHG